MVPDRGDILVVASDDSLYLALTRVALNRTAGLVLTYRLDRDCVDDPLGVCISGALRQYLARADAVRTVMTTDIVEIKDRVRLKELGKFQALLSVLLLH